MENNSNSAETLVHTQKMLSFYRECKVFYRSIKPFTQPNLELRAEVSGNKESDI